MKIRAVRSVTIRQTSRGWLIKEWGQYSRSAAQAQRKVLRGLPEGIAVIFTWEPANLVGTMAVRALAGDVAPEQRPADNT